MVLYDWANSGSVGAFFMAWYGFRSMGELVLFQGNKQEAKFRGDFKTRIGKKIEVNKETAAKERRLLIKMIEMETMKIINSNTHICREL